MVNKTGEALFYQQADVDKRFTLDVEQIVPYPSPISYADRSRFHWPNRKGKELLSISLDLGSKWRWSGGFSLDALGTHYIKLHRVATNEDYFLPLELKLDHGTIIAIFQQKSKDVYPYRIENYTGETVKYWQEDVRQW